MAMDACPCTSPCRWDHLFVQNTGRSTYGLWGFRRAFARRPFLLIVWLIALASMNASRIVASHLTTEIGRSLTEHRRIRQGFQQIVEFL